MDIRLGCDFTFELAADSDALVVVEPHEDDTATVRDATFRTSPASESSVYVDRFGNRIRRLSLHAGRSSLYFDAVAEVSNDADVNCVGLEGHAPSALPEQTLEFLLPSRYCESDVLLSEVVGRFGGAPMDGQRVQDICDWVHHHIRFDYTSSSPLHTAASVYRERTGVCRDFTHLAVAMCRALSVPARYVCGYLPDIGVPDPATPMDFCAWMEVYLGDRWCTFDPRNNERRVGRVVVSRGRDAADCAMVTTFGPATLVEMHVVAERADTHAALATSA